jgi:ribosome-binding protein aMBF1 (putative translation factor)
MTKQTKTNPKKQRTAKQTKKIDSPTLSAEQIVNARKNKGWSQRELASLINKSQSWIRDIESGRFNVKKEEQALLQNILQLES